jgi:5'-methylthioadenosine phosphorylase
MICIFGGTAAYHLTPADFGVAEALPSLETPFGPAPVFMRLTPSGVLFSSRHGADKLTRSAAFVNHRASLWAAKEYGATAILSWNGVGAINPGLAVGDMIAPHDLLDATRARDVAAPRPDEWPGVKEVFWESGRAALLSAIQQFPSPDGAVRNKRGGVYVCTEGPRLETPAEIAAFAQMGADVVGMTLVPEVFIAREMGLPYASVCIVTNIAAGLAPDSINRGQAAPNSLRRFGPQVGREGLAVCLKAAQALSGV